MGCRPLHAGLILNTALVAPSREYSGRSFAENHRLWQVDGFLFVLSAQILYNNTALTVDFSVNAVFCILFPKYQITLEMIAGVQQPHQSVVGLFVGKQTGEALVHHQCLQT